MQLIISGKMVTPTKTPKRNSIIFKTPLPVQNNDDEQERSARRNQSAASVNLTDSANAKLVADNEEFLLCIQKFQQNKITKENAWNSPIIDLLVRLSGKHRKYLNNFSLIATTLEATTKVYELRVDWVHQEVLRMTSGLVRMQVPGRKRGGDDDEGEDGAQNDENIDSDQPKPKPKKKRQIRSTIVKNVETINAPLETEPFIDPIFAQMKSYIGDVGSTKRSFMYLLGTSNSEILLNSEDAFWRPVENPDLIDPENDDRPNEIEPVEEQQYVVIENSPFEEPPTQLRTLLREYTMTDKPNDIIAEVCGEDEENPNSDEYDDHFDAPLNCDESENPSHAAYAFDMNAEVEPITLDGPCNTMHLESLNNLDSYHDYEIGNALRPIHQDDLIVSTMAPNDASRRILEYSYRSLDNINKYWAGPSFWKIVPPRIKNVNPDSKVTKRKRKQKTWEPVICVKDLSSLGTKEFDAKQMPKMKSWDAKKLKLPTKYEIDDTEYFFYGRAILSHMGDESANLLVMENAPLATPQNISVQDDPQQPNDDAMLEMDDNCMMATDDHHDFGNDDASDHDNNLIPSISANKSISMHFEGAPEKLEKIVLLPYAKHAKLVDMKQLKLSCWRSFNIVKEKTAEQRNLDDRDKSYLKKVTKHLCNRNENYKPGYGTFHEIVKGLPKLLTKKQENNLSTALAFSAILHLANDHGLRFLPTLDCSSDFKIVKIDAIDGENANEN